MLPRPTILLTLTVSFLLNFFPLTASPASALSIGLVVEGGQQAPGLPEGVLFNIVRPAAINADGQPANPQTDGGNPLRVQEQRWFSVKITPYTAYACRNIQKV